MGEESACAAGLVPGVVGHDDFRRILARVLCRPARQRRPIVLRVGRHDAGGDSLGPRLRAQARAGDIVGCPGPPGYAVRPEGAGLAEARAIARRLSRSPGVPVGLTRVTPCEDAAAVVGRLCSARQPALATVVDLAAG